jgi:hypothetical protein
VVLRVIPANKGFLAFQAAFLGIASRHWFAKRFNSDSQIERPQPFARSELLLRASPDVGPLHPVVISGPAPASRIAAG